MNEETDEDIDKCSDTDHGMCKARDRDKDKTKDTGEAK